MVDNAGTAAVPRFGRRALMVYSEVIIDCCVDGIGTLDGPGVVLLQRKQLQHPNCILGRSCSS